MSETGLSVTTNARERKRADETERLEHELRLIVTECARAETLEDSVAAVLEQLDAMPHLNAYFRQQAAGSLIYDARARLRSQIGRQAAWSLPERAARMGAERMAARISAYDWPLPNADVRLGDAGVDDLEGAAVYHDARAAGEQQRATMYRQIAKILKRSRAARVRDGVSEQKLAEVMRGAE